MKSTEAQVREYFLRPMSECWAPPYRCPNPEATLRHYAEALIAYPPESLQGAWIGLRNSWQENSWPPIGVITQAVRDWIHSNIKMPTEASPEPVEGWKRYPELADKAMRTEHGQRALNEGWGRILFDHVYRTGTFKGFTRAHGVSIDAAVRRTVQELEADRSLSSLMSANLALGRKILAREAELARKYLVGGDK